MRQCKWAGSQFGSMNCMPDLRKITDARLRSLIGEQARTWRSRGATLEWRWVQAEARHRGWDPAVVAEEELRKEAAAGPL